MSFDPDDPEVTAAAGRLEDLPLFSGAAPPRPRTGRLREISLDAGARALAETAAQHATEIRRLVPIAQALASCGEITIADLRERAVALGALTGAEAGRQLSYLGAVMREAGLEQTGAYRRSHVEQSHGNLHAVWRRPS